MCNLMRFVEMFILWYDTFFNVRLKRRGYVIPNCIYEYFLGYLTRILRTAIKPIVIG